ncbi:unnamed protein product, partial [Meganyctiphanes norvegica]
RKKVVMIGRSIRWLGMFAVVYAVGAMEIRVESELKDLNAELSREKRQVQDVGRMAFFTPLPFPVPLLDEGWIQNNRPNCKGRNRFRPECQPNNGKANCNLIRNRDLPVCRKQAVVDGVVAEAFAKVQWFNQLASPNKSALRIPNLPGTPNKAEQRRLYPLGGSMQRDRPFQPCVTPRL